MVQGLFIRRISRRLSEVEVSGNTFEAYISNGKSVSHKKIRRVSLDQFYALVTGQEDAFYKMCMVLPKVIEKVVNEGGEDVKVPHDSVMSELRRIAKEMNTDDENLAMAIAVYLLGFSTYNGFSKVAGNVVDDVDEKALKRIYEYARRIVKKD